MASKKRLARDGRRIQRTLAAAGKTGIKSVALAMGANRVAAQRTALAISALSDPARADYAELGRILPEKLSALNNAAFDIALRSGDIARQIAGYSSAETAKLASVAAALAACRSPAAVAAIQAQFATAWFFRSLSHAITLNELSMRAWGGLVAPLHQVVMGNVRRLR